MSELRKPDTSKERLLVQCLQDMWETVTLGKGMPKWKRTDTKTSGAPRALAKVQVKVQAKAEAKARNEHLKHACAVEKKDTR